MKLSLTVLEKPGIQDDTLSSISFKDDAIVELVTFWSNIQYQSPQFPLELSPMSSSQLSHLYEGGRIPVIKPNENIRFEVSISSPFKEIITDLTIVQLKVSFLGSMKDGKLETKLPWEKYFELDQKEYGSKVIPDGSIFIEPKTSSSSILLHSKKNTQGQQFDDFHIAYQVLVSFKVDKVTYYALFDPVARVSSRGDG